MYYTEMLSNMLIQWIEEFIVIYDKVVIIQEMWTIHSSAHLYNCMIFF